MVDRTPRWYVAKARPSQARRALENLDRQGFEVYYPLLIIERVRHHKVVTESEPLFPGYIIVKLTLTDDTWRTVNSTRGVNKLISDTPAGAPVAIRAGFVEKLMATEASGGLKKSEVKRIKKGDRVRIKHGPFVTKTGICTKAKQERIELLLDLLGREVVITTPAHAVEKF